MDALGEEVPDAIGYLWKAFFANTCPDEGFWLWLREYDARTREEVYAKMRGGGALNLEMLQALDLKPWRPISCAQRRVLSLSGNDAYFADGIYIGPLISKHLVIRMKSRWPNSIALAGMAGFDTGWAVKEARAWCRRAPEQSYSSIALYPSYIFPSPDNYLSGPMVLTCSRVTTSIENKSLAKITPGFSPVAFFDENRYWTDDSRSWSSEQVTTSEMEMIRSSHPGIPTSIILPPILITNDETILSSAGKGLIPWIEVIMPYSNLI